MGWAHDHSVFALSRMYHMLDLGLFVDEDGKRYRLFGDLGYHCGPNILHLPAHIQPSRTPKTQAQLSPSTR